MKSLLLLVAMLYSSILGLSADESEKKERRHIEIYIVHEKRVTIRMKNGALNSNEKELEDGAAPLSIKDLLDINKIVFHEKGIKATIIFSFGYKENTHEFKMLCHLLKAILEKQNCTVYEVMISTNGASNIYVSGPNKAAYEARQKQLREDFEKRMKKQEKTQTEFTKETSFMKLMDRKCRENKWKNFNWKIDKRGDIQLQVICEESDENPDIEPMLISVRGANEFKVNRTDILNLAQLEQRVKQYSVMAKSAGSLPVFAILTGGHSAAEVQPILLKLHKAGMTSISRLGMPIHEGPVVKPPVNRIPASPHR